MKNQKIISTVKFYKELLKKMTNTAQLSIFSVLMLIATISSVSSYSVQTNQNVIENVCSTPKCVQIASQTIQRMDFSVNPCDDFYQFACGNFVKNTKIPDDKDRVDVFTEINDKVQDQLQSLISENIDSNDVAPFNMAKKLYKMCMDESSIEKRGKEPLISIADKLGGWPVVKGDQWNGSNGDLVTTIKEFRKIGFRTNSIVDVVVQTDLKNSTARKIYVSFLLFNLKFTRKMLIFLSFNIL